MDGQSGKQNKWTDRGASDSLSLSSDARFLGHSIWFDPLTLFLIQHGSFQNKHRGKVKEHSVNMNDYRMENNF